MKKFMLEQGLRVGFIHCQMCVLDRSRLQKIVFSGLLVGILLVSWVSPMAKTSKDNGVRFDSVEILSKAKAEVESRVRLIRSLALEHEIDHKDLIRIEMHYDKIRADVNAGIDRLLVEIETTGKTGAVEPFNRVAMRVSEQVAGFIKSSDELIFGGKRGPSATIDAGVKLVDSLVNALLDIWKTLHSEKNERNELLVQRIESLKWGEFSKID